MSSLIPSRQIAFSIELANTLGLEEAILLQYLSDASSENTNDTSGRFHWYLVSSEQVAKALPFWQAQDIQRIAENLRQQGVILISSPPLQESGELRFAFNEQSHSSALSRAPTHTEQTVNKRSVNESAVRANPIASNWQPDESALKLLAQQSVPNNFARDQIAGFVQYWAERGEARHSWGNRFVTHTLHKWRDYEARQKTHSALEIPSWEQPSRENEAQPMTRSWRPSEDAFEILEFQAGIHRNFIEDAVPEFILYWAERGDRSNTWNARFSSHVKRQWAEFQHTLKNESRPTAMQEGWQPSDDVFDVLRFARIDLEFARNLVPEFVMYWRERNEMRPSWNTLFLQFTKQQWQRRNQSENNLRERSIVEDLSDRSWAN